MIVAFVCGAAGGYLASELLDSPPLVQAAAMFFGAALAWLVYGLIVSEPPPGSSDHAQSWHRDDDDDDDTTIYLPPGHTILQLPDRLVRRLHRAVPDASPVEAIEVLLYRDDMSRLPTANREDA